MNETVSTSEYINHDYILYLWLEMLEILSFIGHFNTSTIDFLCHKSDLIPLLFLTHTLTTTWCNLNLQNSAKFGELPSVSSTHPSPRTDLLRIFYLISSLGELFLFLFSWSNNRQYCRTLTEHIVSTFMYIVHYLTAVWTQYRYYPLQYYIVRLRCHSDSISGDSLAAVPH